MRPYDLPFDPAELAMLHETGYFGVSGDQLAEIAGILAARGLEYPSRGALADACRSLGIDPANLTDDDIREIREMLSDE